MFWRIAARNIVSSPARIAEFDETLPIYRVRSAEKWMMLDRVVSVASSDRLPALDNDAARCERMKSIKLAEVNGRAIK